MLAADAVREGFFRFDPSDGIYTDHFPGYPVVPGSLIIQAFLDVAGAVREIEEFRFRSFLCPGDYRYRLTRRDDRWECTLTQEEQIMVRGKLRI
jgi:3-hydroxyacyl-[acyl-carrier-protein] dehydratase